MKFLSKIIIMTLIILGTGCATTGTQTQNSSVKKITDKELVLASMKLTPSFEDEWSSRFLDTYIRKMESSILNRFKAPKNEFERSAYQNRRDQVLDKLREEAEGFSLNKEYKYVYKNGVALGEYDFVTKSFPLEKFGNFHITITSAATNEGFYSGKLSIKYPAHFNKALPISEKEGRSIIERSYARDRSQHRKVFPVITYKLIGAKQNDTERLQAAEEAYQDTVDSISAMDSAMNNALNDGGLPSQGPSNYNLKKAAQKRNQIKNEAAEGLKAVVTGITIYRRPEHIWVNTTLFNKRFLKP